LKAVALIEIDTTLRNPADLGKSVAVSGLVDTGVTLTVLPRTVAKSLEIAKKSTVTVMTAGGPVNVDISSVEIELAGKKETVRVAISDIIDRVLIGVTTLEILGLAVDPVSGHLKESMYLLY
jgi:aspartyl protease family protein